MRKNTDREYFYETITKLKDVWEANPDQRLGQLLVNVINPEALCSEIFYISDKDLLAKLKEYKETK